MKHGTWLSHRIPLLLLSLVLIAAGLSPALAEIPGIELSFDDAPTGSSDPLQNTASEGSDTQPFPPSGPVMLLTLEGDAKRSSMSEGKYGRAADLDGVEDYILASNLYPGYFAPHLYAWWNLESATGGIFWSEWCRFQVGLNQGALYVGSTTARALYSRSTPRVSHGRPLATGIISPFTGPAARRTSSSFSALTSVTRRRS